MKQITEDYCSYEIAVLLKEKGFDEPCWNYYYNSKLEHYFRPVKNSEWPLNRVSAPTHQMALKWLREIYHCHVIIEYTFKADAKLTNDYVSYCYSAENANTFIAFTQDEWYDTYEQAVEAALLYVLKNLI